MTKRPWTDADVARMVYLREVERLKWSEVDLAMQRSAGGSKSKYDSRRCGQAPTGNVLEPGGRVILSIEQEDGRRARRNAEDRMSLTAILCGDPPPGYSALDRRGQ